MWQPANRAWRSLRGTRYEKVALRFLKSRGLRLVAANYHCPLGELDLVMMHGEMLVFAEVRYRDSRRFGGALPSVDTGKQGRLIRTARHFLQKHVRLQHLACRFDVVGIEPDDLGKTRVQWIQNAFY